MAAQEVKIVWSKPATRHLRAAYEYWRREESENAAAGMLDRIFSTVELLEHSPEMGRPGRVSGTCELILRPLPFVLAYRVRRTRIDIVALLHGARRWPGQF